MKNVKNKLASVVAIAPSVNTLYSTDYALSGGLATIKNYSSIWCCGIMLLFIMILYLILLKTENLRLKNTARKLFPIATFLIIVFTQILIYKTLYDPSSFTIAFGSSGLFYILERCVILLLFALIILIAISTIVSASIKLKKKNEKNIGKEKKTLLFSILVCIICLEVLIFSAIDGFFDNLVMFTSILSIIIAMIVYHGFKKRNLRKIIKKIGIIIAVSELILAIILILILLF